ncbi:FUSC family protein [Photobacterium rosenbergii]|uniref:FUSC family protein n=1 Tax=Photobacterium rosenbergii TaxID=294936 RepID=UPI001C99129B|nr:FUSC family protein [Photobacterium rosenbergii]MBY5947819.1 FUSC family protein [Photobacterium rosenbergii]
MLTLSPASKEALKVAIAFSLSIIIAIAFGWQKPYWAAIAVIVVAANDNYETAIKHGQNRLLGTFAGVAFAFTVVHFFAQDRELFIISILAFSALCVYMSSCERYGYAFKMAFTVGVIIAAMGQFDSYSTFDFAVIRVQETVLGILVYSLVFQFLWPRNSHTLFKRRATIKLEQQIQKVKQQLASHYLQRLTIDDENQSTDDSLVTLLKEAINDSPRVFSERLMWKKLVAFLEDKETDSSNHTYGERRKALINRYQTLSAAILCLKENKEDKILMLPAVSQMTPVTINSHFWADVKHSLFNNYQNRLIYVLRAQAALVTCYAMWIYFPMPGGILFPLISSSFINALCEVPSAYYKYTVLGICTFSVIILSEYVYLMPSFTEGYELAAFYFINIFFIWRLFSTPQLAVLRVLGGNMLVVLTMSAMYLTPVFSITSSLNMLLFMFIILLVSRFYTMLTEEIATGMGLAARG